MSVCLSVCLSIYLLSQVFYLVFVTFQLYSETKDPHVNIILVDFSSTDIDVVAALKRSGLKRYVFFFFNHVCNF